MASISDLPDSLLEYIFSHVSPYQDMKACSMVCSRWHQCTSRAVEVMKARFQKALVSGPLNLKVVGACPTSSFASSRIMQSACVVDSDLYLFGGCTFAQTTFNDLWRINLQTRKMDRVLARSTGVYPSPKSHVPLVLWRDHLLLFGGWTSPCSYPLHQAGVLFDELHCYSIEENLWTALNFPGKPAAVAGHTATVHGDIIVFFGGLQDRGGDVPVSTNSVSCLDMANCTWYKPKTSSEAPSPRYGHSQFKLDDNHIIIMSGCGGYNDLHNDYWLLTIPSDIRSHEPWTWLRLTEEATENMPKKVWCCPTCKVNDTVVVLSYERESQSDASMRMSEFLFKSSKAAPNNISPRRDGNCSRSQDADRAAVPPPAPVLHGGSNPAPASVPDFRPASHSKPSVRRNAYNHPERRNSVLDRYASRLEYLSKSMFVRHPAEEALFAKHARDAKPTCKQAVYLLSLASVLSDGVVRWLPGPTSGCGQVPPHPRLLCSLVEGRGELILCGGKKARECDCDPNDPIPPIVYMKAPSMLPP